MKLRVYIAGKITGDKNYRKKFEVAAAAVERLGCFALSPAVLPSEGWEWHEYMQISQAMLHVCDAIAVLPDWTESCGAIEEVDQAIREHKKILLLNSEGLHELEFELERKQRLHLLLREEEQKERENNMKKPERTQDERRMKIAVHIVATFKELDALGTGSEELKQEAIHDTGLTLYDLCTLENAQQRAQKWEQRLEDKKKNAPGGAQEERQRGGYRKA